MTGRHHRTRGVLPGFLVVLGAVPWAVAAHADTQARASSATAAASAPRESGVAVLAQGDAADFTWPLAQEVYRRPSLRPALVDEARARVLAGEAPAQGASQVIRDLSDTRAAVHGDDAPSRHLLASLAGDLHVRAVVVVSVKEEAAPLVTIAPASTADGGAAEPPPPHRVAVAHVFLAETGAFDAAEYTPDDSFTVSWRAAGQSLERTYGREPSPSPLSAAAPSSSAPAHKAATGEGHEPSRPFYTSPWFWGAIGAAAFGATAVYFATRDNSDGTIHLQMQVPK